MAEDTTHSNTDGSTAGQGLTLGDRSQGYEVTSRARIKGLANAYERSNSNAGDSAVTLILVAEDTAQAAIAAQAQAYQQLNADALVAAHSVVRFGGGTAVVIGAGQGALLAGETLTSWLKGRPAMALGQACALLLPLAKALAGLHSLGLAHGQLSGGQILVGADGALRALAPFDIEGAQAQAEAKQTQAPELVGGGAPDPVCDVYALCALLSWMLRGAPDPSADDRLSAQAKRDDDPYVPLAQALPDLEPDIAQLIDSGMRLHPATRPQSMAALIAVLESHALPIEAAPAAPPPLPDQAPRHGRVPTIPKTTHTIGEAPRKTDAGGPPDLPKGSARSTSRPGKRKNRFWKILSFVIAGSIAWFVASDHFVSDDTSSSTGPTTQSQEQTPLPRKGPAAVENAPVDMDTNTPPEGVLEQFCNSRFSFEAARDSGTNALLAYVQQCQTIDGAFVDAARRALR